jgi:hypothetical protein
MTLLLLMRPSLPCLPCSQAAATEPNDELEALRAQLEQHDDAAKVGPLNVGGRRVGGGQGCYSMRLGQQAGLAPASGHVHWKMCGMGSCKLQ